ncbi:transcriptional repressor LexA [Clostridiaceae bacterium HSG29]|nr:transcriptional repressor LexA [Clostridiaceae bacterium HSG29]
MRDNLSKRQKDILNFIKLNLQEKGFPPTVREIGKAVGLSSSSSVYSHLIKLEKMEYIRRDPTKPRAIEIIDENGENQNFLTNSSITQIPFLGDVTAGEPILAVQENDDMFPVPNEFINEGSMYFMLKVDGESMINAGIFSDDYVLVEQNESARNGDIVVALINNENATIKRYYKEPDIIRLQPENDTMDPIYSRNVKVIGHIKGVFRKM